MRIDNALLEKVLGLKTWQDFACDNLGLVIHDQPNMLTFVDDERFLQQAANNQNVTAILITEALAPHLASKEIKKIVCEDPRYDYYVLMNYLGAANYRKTPAVIHPTATISPAAWVADYNVQIGERVVVEPNATILPDVVIGDNCIIRAGTVLGSEGFEHKRTTKGMLSVFHDGTVIIGKGVEIGSNCTVDKGFSYRPTSIGDFTRIDNLVHIAHCASIGKRCVIVACSMIAGTATIMDDVWIGPNATISSQIVVENGAFITLGSVVVGGVKEKERVSGNFAVPHKKFLHNLKKILSA